MSNNFLLSIKFHKDYFPTPDQVLHHQFKRIKKNFDYIKSKTTKLYPGINEIKIPIKYDDVKILEKQLLQQFYEKHWTTSTIYIIFLYSKTEHLKKYHEKNKTCWGLRIVCGEEYVKIFKKSLEENLEEEKKDNS